MIDYIWEYPYKLSPFFSSITRTFLRLRPFSYIFIFALIFPLIGYQVYASLNSPKINYSDKIDIGFIGSLSGINPYPNVPILEPIPTSERIINRILFDRLVDFDNNGNLINNLIDGYISANEFKVFTFTLKKDILWSDGDRFTSDDVIKSFELIRSEPRGLYFTALNDIEIKKVNDFQVEFKLKKGNSFFAETLTWPIVPAHIFNTNESYSEQIKKIAFRSTPVTTGQWIISDRNSTKIELSKNPFYSREKAKVNFLSVTGFENKTDISNAIKSRDIDLYFTSESDIQENQSFNVRAVSVTRQYYALYFNLSDSGVPWAKDQNIRKALAYAIKKDDITKDTFQKVFGPLPEQSPYYYKDIDKYDYSSQKANEFLDKAGYKLVNNVRVKDGQNLRIVLSVQEKTLRVETAREIQKAWSELGIEVTVNEEPDSDVIGGELLRNRFATNVILPKKFEVVLYGVEAPAGWDRFSLWHSVETKNSSETYSNNIGEYKNSKVDINLENARLDTDGTKRLNDFIRFQRFVTDDVPAIFLYNPNLYIVYSRQIENLDLKRINSPEDLFIRLYDLKIRS